MSAAPSWAPHVAQLQVISDQPINRRLGVWSNGSDRRGPPAIAAAEEYTVFGWDDTRNGTELAPTQDIFARAGSARMGPCPSWPPSPSSVPAWPPEPSTPSSARGR